jgi:hypothetical protein
MKKIFTLFLVVYSAISFSQSSVSTLGSGDWNDPLIWSTSSVPTASSNVVISAGHTITVDGSGNCNNVTVCGLSVLKSDSGTVLNVRGNWINNGNYAFGKGKISFNGSVPQSISGNSVTTFYQMEINNASGVALNNDVKVVYLVSFISGTLSTTGFQLTLLSDTFGTASVGPLGAGTDINGDITVQRYLSSSATGWRFLGSPVRTTMQSWNDDFVTSGFPGSTYPNFYWCSVYSYDETVIGTSDYGYLSPVNITDSLYPGMGYWAYIGPTPLVIDVTGKPNKFNQTFSISLTPSVGKGEDGWNMVSNPYPSAIDWDSPGWTKSGIQNAIYIWDPVLEQYSSYINGIGVNGGSNIIPSSQAFWIEADQVNPVLSCTENVKTTQDKTFQRANSNKIPVKLTLSGNGYKDETVICLASGSSKSVAPQEDARKLFTDNPLVPSISSIADATSLVINTLPFDDAETIVPLNVKAGANGTYTISQAGTVSFPENVCVALKDVLTGSVTDLKTQSSYTFNMNAGNYSDRFYLKISRPLSKSAVPVVCSYDKNGKAVIQYTASASWKSEWKDENNNIISVRSNSLSSDTLSNLEAGTFYVTVTDSGAFCPSVTEKITVQGPADLQAGATITDNLCANSGNGAITAGITGGTAPYAYAWSNAQTSSGIQNLASGIYTLITTDQAGCKDTSLHQVKTLSTLQADFTIDNDPHQLMVSEPVVFTNLSYGQTSVMWNFGDGGSSDNHPSHSYSSPGTYTVILTSLDNFCATTAQRIIQVRALPAENPTTAFGEVKISGSENKAVVQFELKETSEAFITVYNMEGKLLQSRQVLSHNNSEMMELGESHGMYLVRVQAGGTNYQKKILK